MKMDFVLSTTTDYAMQKALQKVLAQAEQDVFGSYIVVAPETKTLEVERFLLENSKTKAFANIYIYSFSRLLKRVQIKPVFPLSKEAGVMIVRNLVMALSGDLTCYKKTAGTVGFAENIYETIQQLKSSGISPIELSETAKKCPTALKIKLEDIALIYDAYENYLGEELVDPSDKLSMLESQLEVSDKIKNSHIYVVGFDSLTANACSVIKGFVKNALSVTVSASFIHKDKKNSHIADNEVFEHLKAVAESLHIKYDPEFYEKPLSGDFKHIVENLYSYPLKKEKTQGNLKLMGFPNFETEAKKVASLIKQDIILGKCRYKDNCVYVADSGITDIIASAFDEFEIPYFVAEPFEFESHELFVFIKLLFLMIRKNMEAEDVLKFARSGLIGLDFDMVDDFENYVLKYGINHNKFLKPFTFGNGAMSSQNAEKVREELCNIVKKFADVYNETMTIGEISTSVLAFLEEYGMELKLKVLQEKQELLGKQRHSYATKQAYGKAVEVLSMLSQFLGEQKAKLEDFYTLLISGLESADISLLPLSIDQVQIVASADGLYDIKNLYVVGASDGNFPIREQDLGLIQDAEIGALEGLSEKKIEPTIKTINRRERFKVFELLSLAKEKLTISFSEHISGGEEAKMTALMQSLSALFLDKNGDDFPINKYYNAFDGEEVDKNNLKGFAIRLGTKRVALNYLSESLSKYRQGLNYEQGTYFVHSLYKALEDDFDEDTKKWFNNINKDQENLIISNAKDLFFPKGTTSISQIERYFACPFEHFATYGLKLKEKELASMRALDVGDILHEVAEKFINFTKNHKDIKIETVASNLLKSVLSKEKYSEEDNRILIKILESEAVRLCKNLYAELEVSSFKLLATEKWFGKNGEYKGILLNDENKIELVGKIDRIDQTDKYYRLIDYKTGKIESSAEDIYYGRKLQLALYLSAIDEIKKEPAGVLYFPIRNEFADGKAKAQETYKMKGFILNDPNAIFSMDNSICYDNPKSRFVFPVLNAGKEAVKKGEIAFRKDDSLLTSGQMKSMASYAVAVSTKAVEEMVEGYVEASPYKHSGKMTCDHCEFKNVCGIMSKDYSSVREPLLSNAKDFYQGEKIWDKK